MFNLELFKSTDNPWTSFVFNQAFDAYFPIVYPHNQYGAEGLLNPFSFINNLEEKEIIKQSLSGVTLRYVFAISNLDDFVKKFISLGFDKQQYLFWTGEHEKWAMVSDSKREIAMYGMPYKFADQIELFYQNSILSPRDFLRKAGASTEIDSFEKYYFPSDILTKGSEENPLWSKYFVSCYVDNENDKIFYWKNFEKLFHTFSTLLSEYKSIYFWHDQCFNRWYWRNKQWYSAGRNASTGGWQKFNYANCHKAATKFLHTNDHLIANFNDDKEKVKEYYINNPKGLIGFMNLWIYGAQNSSLNAHSFKDFFFKCGLYEFGNITDKINQKFEFAFKSSTITPDNVEKAIQEIRKNFSVVKIEKIEKPYTLAIFDFDHKLKIDSIYNYRLEI